MYRGTPGIIVSNLYFALSPNEKDPARFKNCNFTNTPLTHFKKHEYQRTLCSMLQTQPFAGSINSDISRRNASSRKLSTRHGLDTGAYAPFMQGISHPRTHRRLLLCLHSGDYQPDTGHYQPASCGEEKRVPWMRGLRSMHSSKNSSKGSRKRWRDT